MPLQNVAEKMWDRTQEDGTKKKRIFSSYQMNMTLNWQTKKEEVVTVRKGTKDGEMVACSKYPRKRGPAVAWNCLLENPFLLEVHEHCHSFSPAQLRCTPESMVIDKRSGVMTIKHCSTKQIVCL